MSSEIIAQMPEETKKASLFIQTIWAKNHGLIARTKQELDATAKYTHTEAREYLLKMQRMCKEKRMAA